MALVVDPGAVGGQCAAVVVGLADVESEVDVVGGGVFLVFSFLDAGEVGVVVVEDHWWPHSRRGHPCLR
jgi:hypothetical protein